MSEEEFRSLARKTAVSLRRNVNQDCRKSKARLNDEEMLRLVEIMDLFYEQKMKRDNMDEHTIPIEKVDPPKEDDIERNEYIKGVRELAIFLQCGNNKANAIAKSGVLVAEKVQFKFGRAYYFDRVKLKDVLTLKPNIFKDVHWH